MNVLGIREPSKKNGDVFWTSPYEDAGTGKMLTTAAIAVKDKQGQIIGVLGIDLSYASQKTISGLNIGRTGSVTLVSKSGTIIASQGKSKRYTFKSGKSISKNVVFKAIKAAKQKQGTLKVKNSDTSQILYNKKGDEWSFSVVDKNDLQTELHTLLMISIITMLVLVLIVSFYALYASKFIRETVAIYIQHFEAANNGDAEKGFATVATEIRKLSEQSKMSTKEIIDILGKIRNNADDIANKMNVSIEGGEKQIKLIDRALTSSRNVFYITKN